MAGSWKPQGEAHNMQADVTGFRLEGKQSSLKTITKTKPFMLSRLSPLCSIFNQLDVARFHMALTSRWSSKGKALLWAECESFRRLSAGSNNHWHDFLPLYGLHILMGAWDRVQREPCSSWGLRWRLPSLSRLHLHRLYWLCDDKCWQIVCALLFSQTEVRLHERRLRARQPWL